MVELTEVELGGGLALGPVVDGPDTGGAVPDPAVTVEVSVGADVGSELGAATLREVDPAPHALRRSPAANVVATSIVAAVRRTTLLLPDREGIFPHRPPPRRVNASVRSRTRLAPGDRRAAITPGAKRVTRA